MRNGKARHCSTTIARWATCAWRVRWPSRLHMHRSFPPPSSLAMTRAQRSSPLSRRGMNLLCMSSDLGGARRLAAVHVPTSAIRGCTTSCFDRRIAAARDEQRRDLPHRAVHLTHSRNSYMSPRPSPQVKPRARSEPRCYPSTSRVAQGVPDPDRGCCGGSPPRRCTRSPPRPRSARPAGSRCSAVRRGSGRPAGPRDRCHRRQTTASAGPRWTARECGWRHCRRLPLRRVLRLRIERDKQRPWCRPVRIVSVARAFHRA